MSNYVEANIGYLADAQELQQRYINQLHTDSIRYANHLDVSMSNYVMKNDINILKITSDNSNVLLGDLRKLDWQLQSNVLNLNKLYNQIDNISTDFVKEGHRNLYFTPDRVLTIVNPSITYLNDAILVNKNKIKLLDILGQQNTSAISSLDAKVIRLDGNMSNYVNINISNLVHAQEQQLQYMNQLHDNLDTNMSNHVITITHNISQTCNVLSGDLRKLDVRLQSNVSAINIEIMQLQSNVIIQDATLHTRINNLNTNDISEASSNLYFTSERVARIVDASNAVTRDYVRTVDNRLQTAIDGNFTCLNDAILVNKNNIRLLDILGQQHTSAISSLDAKVIRLDGNMSNYVEANIGYLTDALELQQRYINQLHTDSIRYACNLLVDNVNTITNNIFQTCNVLSGD
jgi:predicted RNA-binding protein